MNKFMLISISMSNWDDTSRIPVEIQFSEILLLTVEFN